MGPVSTSSAPVSTAARQIRAAVSLRLLLVAALAGALTLLGGSPASAHAQLVRSSPADGATLAAVPPEVALTFNEAINPDFVTVKVSSDSGEAGRGEPEVDGDTVYQPLDPTIEQGEYTVAYKVTSADGHPVSGTISFTYSSSGGESDAGAPTSSASEDQSETSAGSEESDDDPTSSEASDTASETPTGTTSETPSETATDTQSPSETTGGTEATDAQSDAETTADEGTPWWLWLLVALGALALIGGLIAFIAGRRGRDDDFYDLRSERNDDGEPDVRRFRDDDLR